jgi:hypothetical protein
MKTPINTETKDKIVMFLTLTVWVIGFIAVILIHFKQI